MCGKPEVYPQAEASGQVNRPFHWKAGSVFQSAVNAVP